MEVEVVAVVVVVVDEEVGGVHDSSCPQCGAPDSATTPRRSRSCWMSARSITRAMACLGSEEEEEEEEVAVPSMPPLKSSRPVTAIRCR